jgi:hypothetical protein
MCGLRARVKDGRLVIDGLDAKVTLRTELSPAAGLATSPSRQGSPYRRRDQGPAAQLMEVIVVPDAELQIRFIDG